MVASTQSASRRRRKTHCITNLNKGKPIKWDSLTDEEMKTFKTLKDKIVNPLILTLPKANRPLILDTDACDHQLGYVLLQQQEDIKT